MLTKKHYALTAVLLTCIFSFIFWIILPASVIDARSDNILLLAVKIIFLGATTAIFLTIVLIIVTKKEYVRNQINSLNKYKHLMRLLVKRDFVTRYRRSVLGVLWSLLNPLLTMLVLTMVFSQIFRIQITNFAVYFLGGQIIYNFFSESTTLAMGSILGSAGIIKKVYVPKYIFPITRVFSSLVNFGFSFLAFLLVFVLTKAPFHWTILLIPIPIIYTFIFSVGIGLILASMSIFFRDLTYLYGVLTLILMYLTPIMYPVDILPPIALQFIGLNPLYHFVDYFRNLAINGVIPDMWQNIVCLGYALAALCCGVYVIMSKQDKFILYI